MRMDPRTRFLLELLARVRGQSISTVVERAVQEAAERLSIGESEHREGRNWRDYWDIVEGIRQLKLAADSNTFPSYEEEKRYDFTRTHWPFFYYDNRCENHRSGYIHILWPRIDEFVSFWENTRPRDYFAAGRAMQDALRAANLAAPDWPIKPPDQAPKAAGTRSGWDKPKSADLDDDIPF